MSERETDTPAFPSHGSMGEVTHEGMSLRDWFAGQALAGIIQADGAQFFSNPTDHAWTAYAHADAMIAERNKP